MCDKGRFAYPHLYADDRIREPLERMRRRGFTELSWNDALDRAEELLRAGRGRIVTALSGTETLEQAYGLAKLLRHGLDAHSAVLPEATSDVLDAFRAPLSTIGRAELVVVIGDERVADRAPIVDLWIKQARRHGARVLQHADTKPDEKLEQDLAASDRAVLRLVGPRRGRRRPPRRAGPPGRVRRQARLRRVLTSCDAERPGSVRARAGVPPTRKTRARSGSDQSGRRRRGGSRSARSPKGRRNGVAITMFHGLATGWADLVLPGTSYLERDGTYVNLEGRVQRLRRAVIPPAPDELAWIAKLAERFDVELSPHPSVVFAELSERLYGRELSYDDLGERAPLPGRSAFEPPPPAPEAPSPPTPAPAADQLLGNLRLQRYRPLFSGPAVERVPELQFQRPAPEVELAHADAERRQIANGDTVSVRSNGTSVELRARVSRTLAAGTARIAEEHAADLHRDVEVVRT